MSETNGIRVRDSELLPPQPKVFDTSMIRAALKKQDEKMDDLHKDMTVSRIEIEHRISALEEKLDGFETTQGRPFPEMEFEGEQDGDRLLVVINSSLPLKAANAIVNSLAEALNDDSAYIETSPTGRIGILTPTKQRRDAA